MKSEKQRNEISAYLDGEARSEEAVRERIEADADTAAYYNELKSVSNAVRALPEATPRHGFAQRVCACIEAAGQETVKAWRMPLTAHATLAAALVVGVVAFKSVAPSPSGSVQPESPVIAMSLQEEEQALVARLEQRINADAANNEPTAVGLYVSRQPSEVYNERLLGLVSNMDYMQAFPAVSGSDYSTLVNTLDPAGRQAFKELLSTTIERESSNDEG
jgi:negative regulator of sigma E activity